MSKPRILALLLLFACGPTQGHDHGLTSIDVTPANATIAFGGAISALDYTATGHFSDGHSEVLTDATFMLDPSASVLGVLDAAEFKASGTAAGTGMVQATSGAIVGATSVSVTVHTTNLGPGVPAGAAGDFPDNPPMGPRSPVIDYPLDGAVMPLSVKAPNVQWEGAQAAGDLYRVRMIGGLATVDTIIAVVDNFTFAALPSPADWSLLTASATGQPIAVEVDHWDPTTLANASPIVQIKAVQAEVTGTIYYWDLSGGVMQRLDANGRAPAIPNPPPNPTDAGNHCVACHTVSRDGRYLSAELWGGGDQSAVFDLSNPALATANPAPTVAPVTATSYASLFTAFNDDGTRLLINSGTSLALIDPLTYASIATNGSPLPAANAAHPAWSPDGNTIAFVNNVTLAGAAAPWAVDYDRGDLATIAVTANDTFAAPMAIVQAANVDPAYAAPSWPTFSPDSGYIAYAAGVNSRGRNSNGTTEVTYPGSLFLVAAGGGTPVRLDTACSGAANCFLPNFSPYDSGGYFWLVFYSLRDYGNAQAGTKGTTRRQMWVTAIDKSKLGTGDASLVPYWLPDQDPTTENMSAFWSLPPPIQ